MTLASPLPGLRGYARRAMTDRCRIERDQAATAGAYGGPGVDWQTHLIDQRCKAWFGSGRTTVTEHRAAEVERWRLALPVGTDVRAGDRLVEVLDAAGDVIVDDTLYVDHIAHKRTQLVCDLERRG